MKKSILPNLLFLFLMGCTSVEQPVNTFYPNEVKLLDSWIKQRQDANIAYIRALDVHSLVHNFKINAGLPSTATPLEGWEHPMNGLRGHFTGHYLSTLAKIVAQDIDEEEVLKARLDYLVSELGKCQQALGGTYLSAFPVSDFDILEQTAGGAWAPYYTYHKIMQGLLDAYQLTGNPEALTVVNGMAEFISRRMEAMTPEQIERMLYTRDANPLNEAGGMNEVLYALYNQTRDPEHLRLARLFDRSWFLEPLVNNEDQLAGLHSNTHIVLVNGFAARYGIDSLPAYRQACCNFYNMIENHHSYANGTSSGPRPVPATPTAMTSEHWGKPDQLSTSLTHGIAESCVTHNMQKLTSRLFCWNPDAAYAQDYMNRFFNGVMAAKHPETSQTVYHLPLGSLSVKKFLSEEDFRCCNGSGIEAYSTLSDNIYFHRDHNLWINNYIPSQLMWRNQGVVLDQIGDLMQDPMIVFTLKTEQPTVLNLHFLIPSWAASGSSLRVNGESVSLPEAGSFVSVNRKWKTGDRVELQLEKDFYFREMPDDTDVLAFFYGPSLLAFKTPREMILKGTKSTMLDSLSRDKVSENSFTLRNGGNSYSLMPLYEVTGESYGAYAMIRNY